MKLQGRCWVFPEANVNTDLLRPTSVLRLPVAEQAQAVFETVRPGWSQQVRAGDILVGGKNFGTGSSRPASQVLAHLGIRLLIAESINGLFFRNCINYALPALEIPGILSAVSEGDVLSVDVEAGTVHDERTGATLRGAGIPPELLALIEAGGLLERLKAQQLI